jgi:hypothetical protein
LRSGGGYDFAIDPAQGADRVKVFWLPRLDPAVVLLTPAPQGFSAAANLVGLTPADEQVANDGVYILFRGGTGRLSGVMLAGATQETPLAAVIPLDQHFSARSASALRLWRMLSEAPPHGRPDPLTRPGNACRAHSARSMGDLPKLVIARSPKVYSARCVFRQRLLGKSMNSGTARSASTAPAST